MLLLLLLVLLLLLLLLLPVVVVVVLLLLLVVVVVVVLLLLVVVVAGEAPGNAPFVTSVGPQGSSKPASLPSVTNLATCTHEPACVREAGMEPTKLNTSLTPDGLAGYLSLKGSLPFQLQIRSRAAPQKSKVSLPSMSVFITTYNHKLPPKLPPRLHRRAKCHREKFQQWMRQAAPNLI